MQVGFCSRNWNDPTVRASNPRYQVDHGTTVFYCQPCLTMVGSVMTVVAGHGVYSTLDHGTLPTMVKNYFIVILLKISRKKQNRLCFAKTLQLKHHSCTLDHLKITGLCGTMVNHVQPRFAKNAC